MDLNAIQEQCKIFGWVFTTWHFRIIQIISSTFRRGYFVFSFSLKEGVLLIL